MQFPRIQHINDVLPFIKHKSEFVVKHGEHYTTIDYTHNDEHTFDSPQSLECRGIKFYPDGTIAARPLNKFFNRGEQKELEEKYAVGNFTLREKMDGSMIHPILINGEVRLCTKAGVTSVSEQCEREVVLTDQQKNLLASFCKRGITVVMEYTSPTNRIVIGYDKPSLTVLAARYNECGEYLDAELIARELNLPFTTTYHTPLEDVKQWTDKEGVIIEYCNQFRMKLKADDYVLRHKTKDAISQEKNVLRLVLEDKVDDMVGVMDEQDYRRLVEYRDTVIHHIISVAEHHRLLVEQCAGKERKEVAQGMKNMQDCSPSVFWQVWDGKDAVDVVKGLISKHLSSQTRVDSVRNLIGGTW